MTTVPPAYRVMQHVALHLNEPDSVLRGALAIATAFGEKTSYDQLETRINQIVNTVKSRVHGSQPQAKLAHLHAYMYDEVVFRQQEILTPEGYMLNRVLRTEEGAPTMLAILYYEAVRRLGFNAYAVGIPGAVLIAVEDDGATMYVDPSRGEILDVDEIKKIFIQALDEDEPELDPDTQVSVDLKPMESRLWLTRILQNLLRLYGKSQQYSQLITTLEVEKFLWPEARALDRDLAMVLHRVGRLQEAANMLAGYLSTEKGDPEYEALDRELTEITDKMAEERSKPQTGTN